MEARRERIIEMANDILPCIEQYQRKRRISKHILLICTFCYVLLGGFVVVELSRSINGDEYVVLNKLIMMTAKEAKTTPAAITDRLNSQFHIERISDLKARKWSDALQYLSTLHTN
jgi:hypothetical protein